MTIGRVSGAAGATGVRTESVTAGTESSATGSANTTANVDARTKCRVAARARRAHRIVSRPAARITVALAIVESGNALSESAACDKMSVIVFSSDGGHDRSRTAGRQALR